MTIYRTQPLKLDRVQTYPLKSRSNIVAVAEFARVSAPGTRAVVKQWVKGLTRILGETISVL